MFKKFLVYLLLISTFPFSFAQTSLGFDIRTNADSFTYGDSVEFSLQSHRLDLSKSDINWLLGGKILLSGFGEKKLRLTIPKKEETLLVKVVTPKGEEFTSSIRLSERSVSLYWEATDSYVPFWYAGKRLLVMGGKARVFAFQNITNGGQPIKDQEVLYTWEVNGETDHQNSGLGKNYLDIRIPENGQKRVEIKVTASPRLGNDLVSAYETLNIEEPGVLFYLKKGGSFVKRSLFGEQKFDANDFVLVAEPYFFSLDNKYSYLWMINGRAEEGKKERGFKASNTKGAANVKVEVEHEKRLFQKAESELTLTF